jgi:hypothetical protein
MNTPILQTVRAEVHSDDYAATAKFDAAPWLAQASDGEIEMLICCDFGGDYAADAVALWTRNHNDGVEGVFQYDELARTGFECHVNDEDATAWIAENRPHLIPRS